MESQRGDCTEPVYVSFECWKTTFEKQYSEDEEPKRKEIWEQSLTVVKIHNQAFFARKISYRIELTWFSDQTAEDLEWMQGCSPVIAHEDNVTPNNSPNRIDSTNLPETTSNSEFVDWREHPDFGNCVTPVRDQFKTKTCWIFAAVGAVESRNKIVNGELVELSVQHLFDCMGEDGNGNVENAFKFIKNNHCIREENYKQSPKNKYWKQGQCLATGKPIETTISGYKKVTNEEDLETAVAQGPVAVQLIIHDRAKFQLCVEEDIFYDDVTESSGGKPLHHAMLCVGYGRDETKEEGQQKYWLVKNSWGDKNKNKINSGFIKIAKDRGNNCGIASDAWYPVVVKKQEKIQEPYE